MTALDANRRLAELLGWTGIFDAGGALLGTPPAGEPQCRSQAKVPDWTGDWRDCAPLMIQHLQSITIGACRVSARATKGFGLLRTTSASETLDDAARRVIVHAVIAKLEGGQ